MSIRRTSLGEIASSNTALELVLEALEYCEDREDIEGDSEHIRANDWMEPAELLRAAVWMLKKGKP